MPVLASLPVDDLAGVGSSTAFQAWFVAALGPVADVILAANPPGRSTRVHPGYKWGHATKVLALFVRDLVLFSRYFGDEDADRIATWLYCPVDGIVLDRLRRAGVGPGATLIRELDEPTFWRIQEVLGAAAAAAEAPRVWFDDVWSEDR